MSETRMAAIAACMAVLSAGQPQPAEAARLTHGPVVGGVQAVSTAGSANVFVRTDQAALVAVEWGTRPNLSDARITSEQHTSVVSDYTAIVPLSALPPGTTIYLNVRVDGVRQLSPPFPSFRNFPVSGQPLPFKFIALTDFKTVNLSHGVNVPTFQRASAEQPAFAFIGGDFDHRNPGSLHDRRRMFNELYDPQSPGLADFVNLILRRMPIVHHWDDHDAGGNNIDKTYPFWAEAYGVFVEYVPTYPLPPIPPGIWQKFQYAHVDFFVLDNRSQRDPDTAPDNPSKSMLDGNALGPLGQLSWLKQGLLASTAPWKIIFTSVVTNPKTKFDDGWAAFKTEWTGLRSFIQGAGIRGVVFIAGDLHAGGIDDGRASGFPEMVVPSPNLELCGSGKGKWSQGIYHVSQGPCQGYGVVTVLTNPDRLILEVKDQNGVVRLSHTINGP